VQSEGAGQRSPDLGRRRRGPSPTTAPAAPQRICRSGARQPSALSAERAARLATARPCLHALTATCTSPCLLRAVIILAVLLARCSQCSRNCTGGVFFRFFRLRFLSPPPSPPFLSMLLSRPSPLSPPLSARSAPPSPLAARPAALVRFPPQNDRIARWS